MKICWMFFSIVCLKAFLVSDLNIETIRKNYEIAITDKNICKLMITELDRDHDNTVKLAYLGAFQTIWATHVFNPIKKLDTFNKGKKNIEKSIRLDPNNFEIIFIRHSIQKNSPSFLGYKDNLIEDAVFLSKNLNKISSSELKKRVQNLLKSEIK